MLVFLIGFSIWTPFRQADEIEKFTQEAPSPVPALSIPELEADGISAEKALRDWQGLRSLRAVRLGKVHVLGRHSYSIPGPRVAEVVEAIARALHPEAPWL